MELQIELIELECRWLATIPDEVDGIVPEVLVLTIESIIFSPVELLLLWFTNGDWFFVYDDEDEILESGTLALMVWFSGIMVDRVRVDLRVGVTDPYVSGLLRKEFILLISVIDEDELNCPTESLRLAG